MLKKNILIFIVLAVSTFFSHAVVDRYEKSGADFLTGQWIASPSKKSQTSRVDISENTIALFAGDPKTGINAYQELSRVDQGTILEFSADMKCNDVQLGEKPWNRARILLVQNDGKKDRWDLPHTVASLAGTMDWKNHHNFFTIHPETKKIRAVVQLSQSKGFFELKNIRLYPVRQTKVFTWVRNGLLFSWAAFSLLLVGSCFVMGRKSMIFRVLLVTGFIVIVIGTTMPGEMKNQISNKIKTRIDAKSNAGGKASPRPLQNAPFCPITASGSDFKPRNTQCIPAVKPDLNLVAFLELEQKWAFFKGLSPWNLSKVAHFCFFALFGLILCLMLTMVPAFQVMIFILLLAGSTEMAQFFIDGRSPLFGDFFIDAAGGFFSIFLIRSTGKNKQ